MTTPGPDGVITAADLLFGTTEGAHEELTRHVMSAGRTTARAFERLPRVTREAAVREAAVVAVGLLKIVSFRPFPAERAAALLREVGSVIVLDRADSPGGAAPLHAELAAALYGSGSELHGHVYGLGGRDLHPEDIRRIFAGEAERYVGLRGAACPA